jgi:hypothetical protein
VLDGPVAAGAGAQALAHADHGLEVRIRGHLQLDGDVAGRRLLGRHAGPEDRRGLPRDRRWRRRARTRPDPCKPSIGVGGRLSGGDAAAQAEQRQHLRRSIVIVRYSLNGAAAASRALAPGHDTQMTPAGASMSSEALHVPREKLSRKTLNQHYAITSLIEEMEAVDWYRQRADDCDDPS